VNPAAAQVPADSLRAVLRAVFAGRAYQWRPRRTWSWLVDLFQRIGDWLDALHILHPIIYYALLGVMTAVLLAIVAHFSYLVWRSLRPMLPAPGVAVSTAPIRDAAWHLAEARRLSAAGRYAEALGHRFVALVLQLDERRAVRFDPAKTPAEYVREARLDDVGRSELALLVTRLYHHVFGGAPCGPDDWGLFDRAARAVVAEHVAPR
jgi:hypothetical protein